MSSVVIAGDTSGTVTLAAPAVSGTTTLTLPATTGTVITTGTTGQVINKASLPTGSVLQVVNATSSTLVSTTSATYVTTGLTATITPTSNTSKILVLANAAMQGVASQNTTITLYKNGTNLLGAVGLGYINANTLASNQITATLYLDSPATTSATTYEIYFKTSGGTAYFAAGASTSTITLMEIAA